MIPWLSCAWNGQARQMIELAERCNALQTAAEIESSFPVAT